MGVDREHRDFAPTSGGQSAAGDSLADGGLPVDGGPQVAGGPSAERGMKAEKGMTADHRRETDRRKTARRNARRHVREVRDRLASANAARPVFDYELLRGFAQNRVSASLVVVLLVGMVGSLSSIWVGPFTAAIWTAAVLVIHAVFVMMCRQFMAEKQRAQNVRAWRRRFVVLDLCFGLAWMSILVQPIGVEEGSGTFMLFVMLLVVAISS